MRTRDDGTMAVRLNDALGSWRRGDGDGAAVAGLAGLLQRVGATAPVLRDVRRHRAALVEELEVFDVDALVDRLVELDEGSEPDEVDEVLFALDEVGAAAWFLDHTASVSSAFDAAERTVAAFPEPFAGRADLATAVLTVAPPQPGDPAGGLWRAVEAARGEDRGASTERPTWSLRAVRALAGDLARPPWCVVGGGRGVHVALTAVVGQLHIAVTFAGDDEPSARCGGQDVTLRRGPTGIWLARAAQGVWVVRCAWTRVTFELLD